MNLSRMYWMPLRLQGIRLSVKAESQWIALLQRIRRGEQANLSIFAIMICLVVITEMFGPIIVLSLFADAHRLQEKPDQQQRIFLA